MTEKALGWLRWSPADALGADLNAILIAYEGDVKRLNAISGADQGSRPAPMGLREFAAAHNAAWRAKHASE